MVILAYIDILTEIPNRKMIINRLDFLVTHSVNNKSNFAVVFIDLDNFKRINDSRGHNIIRIQKNLEDLRHLLGGSHQHLVWLVQQNLYRWRKKPVILFQWGMDS
ncbi:diguanylate cyclase domain-containing protein [[Clostridium] fimetarium]|uniref:diguanylate cyclase domain-containing protein n=1 Tax=[Clostridium] fimetarium TaxID=99656 RepID=UPI0011137B01